MKLPRIDLKALEKARQENFKARLDFIDFYAEWVKKTPNKIWSTEQKALVDKQQLK